MSKIIIAVYDPPNGDLPFLAVVINPDGNVIAVPFKSATEAQAHVDQVIKWR